ncbi:MAG: FtsQ-type POTRA domain-containing protein [Clostridia bacterium]|nr:FtsQ-type POTRA domain-containing protein [Clostridia bacterium]
MDGQRPNSTDRNPPVRDWQKDTWYGPAPVNRNPFEEPEDAPELREQRSENLNNRQGEFWNQQTSGYKYSKQQLPAKTEKKEKESMKSRSAGFYILSALLFVGVITAIMHFFVFTVRHIDVIGNVNVSKEEIIRLSAIQPGTPMLTLDGDQAARRIDGSVALEFRYLEKELPDRVVICVREREACCWMTWCGILYTMDKHRVVLYETEDQTVRPSSLVRVDGLQIRSGCMVGQTLVLESSSQQSLFNSLFTEMRVLNCTEMIEEADLSNIASVLLVTRDGFTAALGDSSNLHAKLRSMLLTREELIRMGYHGGTINVINPETPVFSPPVDR